MVAYDEANGPRARAWWSLALAGSFAGGGSRWRLLRLDRRRRRDRNRRGTPENARTTHVGSTDPISAAAADSLSATPRPQPVTAAEVLEALEDGRHALVDARAPEGFAGMSSLLILVAGHVAGACNHPFSRNLDSENRFLPAPELRRRWLETLNGKDPGDTILMCGSGVTACHNALAMDVAGLPGAKLYAGSWSEWIRDPERPVARGAAR